MILDASAHLGPYPFRSLGATAATQLLARMDRVGIDRAVVSSLPAIFYRDTHRGNAELHVETQSHRDRLVPIATINPLYAGWQSDLTESVERWGMKAVALAPDYHGYRLADATATLTRINELRVPVVLTQRLEDRRQRHAWDRAEDLTEGELLATARAFPSLRIYLRNWVALDGKKLADAGLRGRCLIDFARLSVVHTKDVPKLIDALGIEALAFGSHAPFDYAGPSLVKLENLMSLPADDRERIAWRNTATFFGAPPS